MSISKRPVLFATDELEIKDPQSIAQTVYISFVIAFHLKFLYFYHLTRHTA